MRASLLSNSMKTLSKSVAPSVSVEKVQPLGKELAAVLFNVGYSIHKEEELSKAVEAGWGNAIRVLPGSAHRPVAKDARLVLAFVALNNETLPYNNETSEKMTVVTANVFRDENDKIWSKRGEGDEASLVRQSEEDLSALLEQRRSVISETASVGVALHEKVSVGDSAVWYDFAKEKMRYGIVVASELMFDFETKTGCKVSPEQIILAADAPSYIAAEIASFDKKMNGTVDKSNFIGKHIEYMAKLYKSQPEYFGKLLDLLKRGFASNAL